tara:strand:+ start:723 stop:1202 length:480 start_codon:yes stop_codon:yes gene_type:complete
MNSKNKIISPKFAHLFDISLVIGEAHDLGETPNGKKRIVQVVGGEFMGDRVRGNVRTESAADWVLIRPDLSIKLDVRLTLETVDNALVHMRYEGIRHASSKIAKQLLSNKRVDPGDYYWRISPFFETSSKKYNWMNKIVSFGMGEKNGHRVSYAVFELM